MNYLLYKTNRNRYLTLVNSSILHNCKFAFCLLRQNKFDDHSSDFRGLFNSMRDKTVGNRIEDDEEKSIHSIQRSRPGHSLSVN